MAAISGYNGSIQGQTGPGAAFTNALCTDIGTTPRTVYQITNTANRYVDNTVTVTVQTSPDGITWSAATGFTFNAMGGIVTFAAQQATGTQVRVSGNAYPMATFAYFTKWTFDGDRTLIDASALGSMYRVYVPGLISAKVSAERFTTDNYFASKITGNALVVLRLDMGNSQHYDCTTYLTKLKMETPVNGLVTGQQDFTVTGQFSFNTN